MGRTTYANMRNFSHKGSGDKSLCTAPDVCKTPIGNSTPPIPYFVVSQVGDLGGGSSSVKLEGKPTTLKSSNHKSCSGDEPGTAKGVGSGSTSKKTEMTSYSPDVKCDGENVVRAFDTTTMNNKNTMGMVLGAMTSPSVVTAIDVEPWDPEGTPTWIKIQAIYDDRWRTPLPAENVKITVNDEVIQEGVQLNDGAGISTQVYTLEEAQSTNAEPGVLVVEDVPEGKVVIEIVAESGIEQQIQDSKDAIEAQLDGAYRATVAEMAEFQALWDEYGYASIAISGVEGVFNGTATWVRDQADLFEMETWVELGSAISSVTSSSMDYAADYASDKFDSILATANEISQWAEDDAENLLNWSWWGTQVDELASSVEDEVIEMRDSLVEHYDNAMVLLDESKAFIDKIQKHKDEILKLPEYIASGDAVRVENFVDTVVADMYPELAAEIKENPEFHMVLELLSEHDAALVYVVYMQLILESVPPNFYAYIAGKGGAYVGIEIILLVALSFLSLGAGTAARLTMLAARIASSSAKVAGASKKIKKAQKAVDAFVQNINDFVDVLDKYRTLGLLLRKGRSAGLLKVGRSKGTVKVKKENNKRDRRCRRCDSLKHSTPRSVRPRGCVVYK